MSILLTLSFLVGNNRWQLSQNCIFKSFTIAKMAPNIQHLPHISVEEDSRIRCALLGCGMVSTGL